MRRGRESSTPLTGFSRKSLTNPCDRTVRATQAERPRNRRFEAIGGGQPELRARCGGKGRVRTRAWSSPKMASRTSSGVNMILL